MRMRSESAASQPDRAPLSSSGKARWGLRGVRLRSVCGWATALLVAGALVVPVNFVTEEPGPTFNTIGEYEGKQLISIEGRQSYPVSGELSLTTVSVAGGPNTTIGALQTFATWLAPNTVVVPADLIYEPNVTNEQVTTQNTADMTSSQELAQAAALNYLNIDYTEELSVSALASDSPATGSIREGDRLISLGDTELKSYDQIPHILDSNGENPISVTVERDGERLSFKLTPSYSEDAGHYVLGLYISRSYSFPLNVNYGLDSVGGPSAGMMFSLGIIDELTEEDMTGGKNFAGTGTISSNGRVGAIGGIAQKMVGAVDSGATVFLAPADNCQEVVGNIPQGLSVVKVSTLSEAVDAVTGIGAGADPGQFPTCSAD